MHNNIGLYLQSQTNQSVLFATGSRISWNLAAEKSHEDVSIHFVVAVVFSICFVFVCLLFCICSLQTTLLPQMVSEIETTTN